MKSGRQIWARMVEKFSGGAMEKQKPRNITNKPPSTLSVAG